MAKPVRKRIFVPKIVSFNPNSKQGYDGRGTKAFVERGTRLRKGLSHKQKMRQLRMLAMESTHFIKPLSARAKKVREILQQNGVRVEKVIEDLRNGTALFEAEGFDLGSYRG